MILCLVEFISIFFFIDAIFKTVKKMENKIEKKKKIFKELALNFSCVIAVDKKKENDYNMNIQSKIQVILKKKENC